MKPGIVINSKTLLIIPCCKKKRKGGKPLAEFNSVFNFERFWGGATSESILDSRKKIQDEFSRCYQKSDNEFLPAIERYIGNVYEPELKSEGYKKTLPYIQKHYGHGNHPKIMILSALYGPLHPFELIQDYDLVIGKSLKVWKPAFISTLTAYVENNDVDKIVMYTGSGADYFKVLLPAVKTLLMGKLISEAYQYHVVDGGSSLTPVIHGKLFFADISQTVCPALSRDVELRKGPDFSPTTSLSQVEETAETDNVLHPDTNRYPTETPIEDRHVLIEN